MVEILSGEQTGLSQAGADFRSGRPTLLPQNPEAIMAAAHGLMGSEGLSVTIGASEIYDQDGHNIVGNGVRNALNLTTGEPVGIGGEIAESTPKSAPIYIGGESADQIDLVTQHGMKVVFAPAGSPFAQKCRERGKAYLEYKTSEDIAEALLDVSAAVDKESQLAKVS